MIAKIKIKAGTFALNTQNPFFPKSHPVFLAFEKFFWDWIESQDDETEEMYFGSNSIYNKTQAIQSAIQNLAEIIEEKGLKIVSSRDFYKLDLETAFE